MKLIGDIGGTNVRFGLVDENTEITQIIKYKKTDFKDVTEAIQFYKKTVNSDAKEAVLAVNSPVLDNKPDDGTHFWNFNSPTLLKDTGLDKVTYMNDLVAHASAVPYLKPGEKVKFHGKSIHEKGPIVVIGPGTGLGISFGLYNYDQKKYYFYPSEGGSALTSFADEKHIEILRKMYSFKRFLRWEEVISGQGISNLYHALYGKDKPTEEVMADLLAGDKKAEHVWTIFCQFLGILTRDMATTFLATGGIYFIGGVLGRKENVAKLNYDEFIKYYKFTSPENGGFFNDYPIYIVEHPNSAFLGLANY